MKRKPKYRPLTPKERMFLISFIQTGNATQSYYKAGYQPKNANCAGVQAYRLLRRAKMKQEIDEMVKEEGLSKEWVISQAKKVFDESKHPRDKATLLRLLGDIEGCTKHTQTLIQQALPVFNLCQDDLRDAQRILGTSEAGVVRESKSRDRIEDLKTQQQILNPVNNQ
jgi:phage terminase small subunit